MKFDMILVVTGDDFKNLELVVRNSKLYIKPDKIYIISPLAHINKNIKKFKNEEKLIWVDERDILDIKEINFNQANLLDMPERKFWYYQQFLKMAFSYSSHCLKGHYLIWDADTIPLKKMRFFDENGKIYLTSSKYEYHNDYYHNIKVLLGEDMGIYSKSFISQHLMVSKKDMLSLIERLGSLDNAKWINLLLSKIDGKSQSLFSEYETYCNFVLNEYTNSYNVRELEWFRKGAYLTKVHSVKKLSKYYFYIAIEKTDKSIVNFFIYNTIHLLNMLKHFFLKYRNYSPFP